MKFYSDQHWYHIAATTFTTTVTSYDVMSSPVAFGYHLRILTSFGNESNFTKPWILSVSSNKYQQRSTLWEAGYFRTLLESETCPMLFWTAREVHLNTETCHDLLLWFRMWNTCKNNVLWDLWSLSTGNKRQTYTTYVRGWVGVVWYMLFVWIMTMVWRKFCNKLIINLETHKFNSLSIWSLTVNSAGCKQVYRWDFHTNSFWGKFYYHIGTFSRKKLYFAALLYVHPACLSRYE